MEIEKFRYSNCNRWIPVPIKERYNKDYSYIRKSDCYNDGYGYAEYYIQ